MTLELATLVIRAANLVLWLVVVGRVLVTDQPLTRLARRGIATVIVFGMAVFVVGALVPFGLPARAANLLYTAFAAYAGLFALALLTTGEPNGDEESFE